jgi:hypothetical protein
VINFVSQKVLYSYSLSKLNLECLHFIYFSQESYLSDVGLNPLEYWRLTHPLTLQPDPMGLKRGRCKPNDELIVINFVSQKVLYSYSLSKLNMECLLFIYSSQESYLSDVGLNPLDYWPLTHPLRLQPDPLGLKRGRCKPNDGPDRLWYHVTNIEA